MGVAVYAALGYFVAVFASLALFSKIYRRRLANAPPPPSWFPPHKSRDLYISLLSLPEPPPRPILTAALLRRAVDDVKLIWAVRDQKTALTTLLAKGQIGDQTWERFLVAEKELEAEIVEVVGEANTFAEGYGQNIFPLASEMATHEKWKAIYAAIPEERKAAEARLAAGPASLVLSPSSHLTPSSLTLYPSNPLSLSDPSPTPAPTTLALPAVLPPAAPITPSAPTTPARKGLVPAKVIVRKPLAATPVAPAEPSPPPSESTGSAPAGSEASASPPESRAATPSGTGSGTPGSTKKPNKKKKKPAGKK